MVHFMRACWLLLFNEEQAVLTKLVQVLNRSLVCNHLWDTKTPLSVGAMINVNLFSFRCRKIITLILRNKHCSCFWHGD